MSQEKIDKLFNQLISSKKVHEAVLFIENESATVGHEKTYNRDLDTPMLMASTTKLLTTACVYALMQGGKLKLNEKIMTYIPHINLKGLHTIKGVDGSENIRLEHLLFQTSGLPDFYLNGSEPIFKKVKKEDFSYTFDDELHWIGSLEAHFEPGTKGKAYYSDANFDLLGKIIETVNGTSLKVAIEQYITGPLGLKNTYLADVATDFIPHTYYNQEKLQRPLFIRSCFAGGGGVTTARELMIFLKAFYQGKLFDIALLSDLKATHPLQMSFYPIHYGAGYMALKASYPFGAKYTLMGHSGSTGAFAFYCPEKEIYLVGDIPQISTPAKCVRLAIRTTLAL